MPQIPPLAHLRATDGARHGLNEHLNATAEMAQHFAAIWGAGEYARIAGLWHDLGKFAPEFQAMIRAADPDAHLEGVSSGPRRRVDHSTAGAQWATRHFGNKFGRLFAYAIAGHHAGLADWIGDGGERGLEDRLAKENEEHLARATRGEISHNLLAQPLPVTPLPDKIDGSLWVRMLSSALFDADFLDSEGFFDPDRHAGRKAWPDLGSLASNLDAYLAKKFKNVSLNPVNVARAEVLSACRAAAIRSPGLYSLSVPTGGAKTLSSLAFALAHAQHHGLRRVIYAIPFTSIIEQTADVFRKALGDDAVLEHHSALEPAPEAETTRSRLAAENWDAPLIVTTTVQLFESFFASRTSSLRKLHNIAGSVLILDEAQALPTAVLRPVTALLDQLVRHYHVSVVLCTATQPVLGAVFKGLPQREEIMPAPERLFATLDRVDITMPQAGTRRTWEDIASEIAALPQSLVIVNTRSHCRELHRLLPEGAVHLSTWQCAAHRAQLLKSIKARLEQGKPIHVVSTSLIEAGVDIDFPVVFRAMTGLDSLAQAAGRCNRNGLLPKGRFVVFRPEGNVMKEVAQAVEAAEAALRRHGEHPFMPQSFETYFHQLYWTKGDKAMDKYNMFGLLRMGEDRKKGDKLDIRFRTAAEKFRMIEERDEPLIVPFDTTAEAAIARLRYAGPSRDTLRALQRYTVGVLPRTMACLRAADVVEDIAVVTVLKARDLYRDDVGLDCETFANPTSGSLIV